jgi:hypothetical protein
MYAFRVGLPVPPNLAVFTSKRVVRAKYHEERCSILSKVKQASVDGAVSVPELEHTLRIAS